MDNLYIETFGTNINIIKTKTFVFFLSNENVNFLKNTPKFTKKI